jgi:N utilization substance protein B
MGIRRRSRESALQILFGLEWTNGDPEQASELYWQRFAGEKPAAYEEIRRVSSELVDGVVNHSQQIDQRLMDCSHNWKLDRMSAVDRNILRLGAFELMFRSKRVPTKVVLNEAIEIAKKFGSKESSAFVNGILHQVAQASQPASEVLRKGPKKRHAEGVEQEPAHTGDAAETTGEGPP